MSQQKLNNPQNMLGEQGVVNKPDEIHELTHENTNQQIKRGALEEAAYIAYDAIDHHETFQTQQNSYNEVQDQYEEQAFSSESSELPEISESNQSADPLKDRRGGVKSAKSGSGDKPQDTSKSEAENELESGFSGASADRSAKKDQSVRKSRKSPLLLDAKSTERSDIKTEERGGRLLGTAEVSKLSKNSSQLLKNQRVQQRLEGRLEGRRREIQKGYSRFSLGKHSTKEKAAIRYYGRLLNITGENELKIGLSGRLKYHLRVERVKMDRSDYEELLRRKGKRSFRRRTGGRLLFHGFTTAVENESMAEDEVAGDMKRSIRRTGRVATVTSRKGIRTLKRQNNIYARLDAAKAKEQVLLDKRERLLSDAKKKQQKEEVRAAKSMAQKRKLKKQMVQMRVQEEGNFFRRTWQGILVKRRAKKVRQQTVKRTLSTISALSGLLVFFLILLLVFFLIMLAMFTGGAEYYSTAVTQNDYATLTDATGYYRKLEADLDEYLNADREALEAELETEYGPDLYEYVYNLAEFGFSANTLMAYLSAVYGSFTLDDVQAELEAIFEEMYTLTIEVKLENREVSEYNPETGANEIVTKQKKICYITLGKRELEEVVEERMTPDQKGQYSDYRLSTGGQQVYGPVMREDWTNLISSNFGARIHPITKERKMHNGVDIAVPVGTHIYSAVDGTVILARYSESAGNWIKVQTETGWTVVMMHMDSLTVSEGQTVKKGDHLGYSGNTGRSTGPHLHLEVRNADDQPVNPIFIIPQNCVQRGAETEE